MNLPQNHGLSPAEDFERSTAIMRMACRNIMPSTTTTMRVLSCLLLVLSQSLTVSAFMVPSRNLLSSSSSYYSNSDVPYRQKYNNNLVQCRDQEQKEREIDLPSSDVHASDSNSNSNSNSNNTFEAGSSPLFSSQSQQQESSNWASAGSGSIGSLLMQMQKQEEEWRNGNDSTSLEDQAIRLDNVTSSSSSSEDSSTSRDIFDKVKRKDKLLRKQKKPALKRTSESVDEEGYDNKDDGIENLDEGQISKSKDTLSRMNSATARELDDAVTWMVSNPESKSELLDSVKSIPLPSLNTSDSSSDPASAETTTNTEKKELLEPQPLSMPEHYRDRIGRDMRHLAVSIASSIEDVDQWRTFCEEGNGGLMPLLECIREGAHFINLQKQQQKLKDPAYYEGGVFLEQHEESFMAACSACRALRDLCAVSPELSAVISDGILRANAAWSTKTMSTSYRSRAFPSLDEAMEPGHIHNTGNNFMADLMTMLRYANEYTEPSDSRRKRKSNNPFRRSKSRRGK